MATSHDVQESMSPASSTETDTEPHPTDGFNTLRFHVGILVPDLGLVRQPVELCFHDSFTPSSNAPLSLHYQHDGVLSYKTPPTLQTPTPPCYIIECDTIDFLPPELTESPPPETIESTSRETTPLPVRRNTSRYQLLVHASYYCVLIVIVGLVLSNRLICPLLSPPPPSSQQLAHTRHLTKPITVLDELLAVAEAWAAVPLKLFGPRAHAHAHGHNDGEHGDSDPSRNKTYPLALVSQLATELQSAITQEAPFDPTRERHARFESLVQSADTATSVWELRLEIALGFLWSPNVLQHLEWTYDRVRRIRDEADSFFFSSSSPEHAHTIRSTDLARRHVHVSSDGSMTVVNTGTVEDLIKAYNTTLLTTLLEDSHCQFFRGCRSNPNQAFHPVYQLPATLSDGKAHDTPGLVHFLERWFDGDDLGRDDGNGVDDDEPPMVALVRHLAALNTKLDRHLGRARDLGLWDPLAPQAAQHEGPLGMAALWGAAPWSATTTAEVKSDRSPYAPASSKRVRAVAAQLRTMRLHDLFSQQLDAVEALVSVRELCNRLQTSLDLVDDLGRGKWVHVSVEAEPVIVSLDAEEGVGVQLQGRAVFSHGVLEQPSTQAERFNAVRARVQKISMDMTARFTRNQ